jgi:hypothetical protein
MRDLTEARSEKLMCTEFRWAQMADTFDVVLAFLRSGFSLECDADARELSLYLRLIADPVPRAEGGGERARAAPQQAEGHRVRRPVDEAVHLHRQIRQGRS